MHLCSVANFFHPSQILLYSKKLKSGFFQLFLIKLSQEGNFESTKVEIVILVLNPKRVSLVHIAKFEDSCPGHSSGKVILLFKLKTYRPCSVGIFTLCKKFCTCSGWSPAWPKVSLSFDYLTRFRQPSNPIGPSLIFPQKQDAVHTSKWLLMQFCTVFQIKYKSHKIQFFAMV